MQSVGNWYTNALMPFFYISSGLNEAQEGRTKYSILLESGLARSIVSPVIRTLHFASCIVAGKKQCVNIIKTKITWSIFETVTILLACVSVTILRLIKRVFSTPACSSIRIWSANLFDSRRQTNAGHRSMAQSIPSVHIPLRVFVGHLSFCFGKATNTPRWGRAFIPKLHGGDYK